MKLPVFFLRKKVSATKKNTALLQSSIFVVLVLLLLAGCKKPESLQPVSSSNNSLLTLAKKTNIILMLADDIGYEIPSCNGGQSYSTPRIDQMAAQGMRFTQCYASPLCSPSRFMLLTGKYNFRNYNNWGSLDTTNRTIANMLHDKGYKTLVAGKWQLDGGDASIHVFGFDDYMVYAPFDDEGLAKGSRYKNPTFYKDGKVMPKQSAAGKYGDDILVDYIKDFIDSNKNKPFFIYYPVCLSHYPFCPTPDDPEFATWNNGTSTPDKKYFPSMVKYMDKKVGEVIDKVKSAGIADNTIIIYVGDNGTDDRIHSLFLGKEVEGGKSNSYATGIRVPLIVWSPGKVAPKVVNNNLIDFTDFLPTIAGIAGVNVPKKYGVTDGTSFYPTLIGQQGTPRDWVFCHYDRNQKDEVIYPIKRWVNDAKYKLYDSTNTFYNIQKDLFEKSPIPDSKLTPSEKIIKAKFQAVLSAMHN